MVDVGLVIFGLWVVCMIVVMLVLERDCMFCMISMVDVALIKRGLYSTTQSASAPPIQSCTANTHAILPAKRRVRVQPP